MRCWPKGIEFKNLGLVIVDEEQHFGVVHKERLKSLKADVHVLTLTATPIPRTLQLALSGVRDLSLITTPPVDRLAVRTFVTPFDPLVIREALLREHYRGGQSFYVCPRIADLREAQEFLKETVPEVKAAVGHGQMAPSLLEDVMTAFYDRKMDVLISTNIVESGLDIPTANTLIVHRADMFGLSQLYQLRGRIGRSKQRAYAYLTTPADRKLTETAERRLQVLQSLDQLGAGFSVASHDLDIRGAGNLLGDEQSGHVREVGIELYQEMLEEAVSQMRLGGDQSVELADQWSPQINIGAPVLIPEAYVPDLNVRMALYRRLAGIEDSRRDRTFRRRVDRPLRRVAGRSAAPAQDRRDQEPVPHRVGGEDRCGPERRHAHLPQQHLPQSDRPRAPDRRACEHHEGASRPESGDRPQLADPGRTPQRRPIRPRPTRETGRVGIKGRHFQCVDGKDGP